MKKIVSIVFSFCFLFSASAQWTQFPGIPASADIECVRAFDASHYYAGTSNAIFKSDDAGANWQTVLVNDMTGNLIPSVISDIYFISSTEAIAVGWIVLGNSEVILRTTNGGINWNYANLYNGGTWPRVQNSIDFPTSATGYSVGSNGRILKTTNSGSSWTLMSSGTTTELFDVDFTSATTGYAVGNGRIQRTVNGTSWTGTTFTGKIFKSVHFPSATVGYAAGEAGVVYKTTNSGTSWTQLTITDVGVDFTSVFFTDDNTGYLTGDDYIYRTTTGGQYWERLQMAENMNGITFFSPQDGLACGDESQLYHTSNAGLPYKPQPNFSVSPATLCYDSIVNLTNLSDPSWSFEWLLNGVPFSTSFSTSVVVPNAGNSVISLVAFNGSERDTLDKTVTIQPSLDIDLSIGVVNQICAGQSGQVQVYNSSIGTNYRLRNGTTNIGAQQAGNGGTLTFSTGNLSATTTLNIRATRTNSCGSSEAVEYVTVVTQNPDINKVIFANPDTICPNTSTSVFLQLSQNNVSYKLMSGTNTIGVAQPGDGGTLTFTTPGLTTNTTYFIRGTSSPLNCVTNFPAFTVVVENPTIYYTATNANPELNEPVSFLNSTVNPEGTLLWNFGPDATPQTSTSQNVSGVQFSTTGIHNITLTTTTTVGCVKQLTKQIHVIDPVTLQSCDLIQYAGSFGNDGGRLNSLTRDANNNLFTFFENNSSDSLYIYSGHEDTILNNMVSIPEYDEYVTLTKHNPKGIPMWSTYLRFDSGWSDAGDVLTDAAGNVYMVYFHGEHSDDVRIYSTDGRYIVIDPPTDGSSQQSSVIVKFDPNGLYLWHKTVLDVYWIEKISLKFDEVGNLLYCGTNYYKIAPDGTILDSMLFQERHDAVADGQGGVYLAGYGFGYQYVGSGNGIPMPQVNTASGLAVNDYITMDEDHNIYLAGTFSGSFTFGNTTVTDYNPIQSQANADVFVCRINNDGTPGWIKQFSSDWQNMIRGFDVKNGKVVFAMMTIAANFSQVGGATISGPSGTIKNVIFRCDTDGTDDHFSLFNDNGNTSGTTHHLDLLYLNDDATRVDYGFDYRYDFLTPSGVSVDAYPNTTYNGSGILQSSIDCLFNLPELPPVSAFAQDQIACIGTELTLMDQSTYNPTSWNWTFQGGTPATSTEENPQVVFTTPGNHTVTLTTANQYGAGTTATQNVMIYSAPSTNNWIAEDTVCFSVYGTMVDAPPFSGGTYSMSTTSVLTDNTFYPTNDAIGMYTVINYTYTDTNIGCVTHAVDSIFVSNNTPPISSFLIFGEECVGITQTFSDQSSGNPTSWHWTFENGTPATSTAQNPQVVFNATGVYTATLTTSNSTCPGSTTSHQIIVNQAASDDDWISEESLCYVGNYIVLDQPLFGGGTYTPSNIQNSVFFPVQGSNDGIINITYSYTDPNNGCPGVAHDVIEIHDAAITLSPFANDTLCYENQGVQLVSAIPAGGTFSDPYGSTITGNLIFPPAAALNTLYTLTYTYTDPGSTCTNTQDVSVYLDDCILGLEDAGILQPELATLVEGKQYRILNLTSGFSGTVVDAHGQQVLELKNQDRIDLEPFAPGMYFIRITVGASNYVFKINRY